MNIINMHLASFKAEVKIKKLKPQVVGAWQINFPTTTMIPAVTLLHNLSFI